MMLRRDLVYTGVTRGKRLVVMIGQKKALAIAIRAAGQDLRWTNLKAKLQFANQNSGVSGTSGMRLGLKNDIPIAKKTGESS